jgi:hypothetical protein
MTQSTFCTPSVLSAEHRLSMGTLGHARRPLRLRHVVGAALVATLLLAYWMALSASVRRADGLRLAEGSMLQERMACEKLAQARARWACTQVALRGVSHEPVIEP